MNKLKEEFEYLSNRDRIIIGLSGGADSVALTHILFNEFGAKKLICAHVNHMIRGDEADKDTEFCQKYCNSLGIRLEILRKDVPTFAKENNLGEEEAGRIVRYNFFRSLIQNENDVICTAHNADDNAETVLLNLARGTGLKGLCGIPQEREGIYRPILKLTRSEIEAYCKENNLDYVTDSTNLSDDYNRNKIRHNILPVLKGINSGVVDNILRMCDSIKADEVYLSCKAKELVKGSRTTFGYKADVLSKADDAVLNRALMLIADEYKGVKLEKKHIELIKTMLGGGACDVPVNMSCAVSKGKLFFFEKNPKLLEDFEISFGSKDRAMAFANGKSIDIRKRKISQNDINDKKIHNLLFNNSADYDKIKHKLNVSTRKEGDRLTLKRRNITKSLKKIMAEEGIPAQLRDRIIVIRDGESLVFVEGLGVNAEYLPDEKTSVLIKFSID